MDPEVEEARSRVFDEWREELFNGPGLPKGEEEAQKFAEDLYTDAYLLAKEVDRLRAIVGARP